MMKFLIFPFLFLTIFSLNVRAYNKTFVNQCLEEQSYTALLDFAKTIPEQEFDLFLLNAAGFAAFQSNLSDLSASYYTKSYQLDSNNIQANLYLGMVRKQQRRFEEAIQYFNRLLLLKPGQPKYYKYMSDAYFGLKLEDSALSCLANAYRFGPSDLNIITAYSEVLYSKKMYEQASIVVNNGMQIDSNYSALLAIGIRCAYQMKNHKAVLVKAHKLIELNLDASAYSSLMYGVYSALQTKNYEQCLLFTDYLIASKAETEQVLYYAAKAHAGMKQFALSNELLKKCLELAISENTEAYYTEMAENYEQLKMYSKAQKNYDTARYLFGTNILLYRKALAYDAVNDSARAKKAYQEFLRSSKNEDSNIVNFVKRRVGDL